MDKNLIGCFAYAKAGHDAGKLYVIVAVENEYAYLCDGKIRTTDHPKKKSVKHLQFMKTKIEETLLNRILMNEKVYDHEIKYAIKQQSGKED